MQENSDHKTLPGRPFFLYSSISRDFHGNRDPCKFSRTGTYLSSKTKPAKSRSPEQNQTLDPGSLPHKQGDPIRSSYGKTTADGILHYLHVERNPSIQPDPGKNNITFTTFKERTCANYWVISSSF